MSVLNYHNAACAITSVTNSGAASSAPSAASTYNNIYIGS